MSGNLQPIKGTKDLYGDQANQFEYIISKATELFTSYGFGPLYTPIFEFTEVFKRSLGDSSDVVNKEMYSFLDRNSNSLTLRPEFTAAISRAFISNGMAHQLPLRFYSHGPLFRYENPQKGRQRQFHQLNIEALGISSPKMDGELITMAAQMLKKLGILDKTELNINSLGCDISRSSYVEAVVKYFSKYKNDLSEDSQIRLEKNPLRILDSKDANDRKIIKDVPVISNYYTDEARNFFDQVLDYLEIMGIKYKINEKIVRGLDYYCHTAFEFVSDHLGAQGTVLGGGRYDNLIKIMGGPDTAGVGFAAGIERLILLMEQVRAKRLNIIVTFGENEKVQKEALILAKELRDNNITIIDDYDMNSSKKMKRANNIKAKLAFMIGEDEISQNIVKVKDLDTGEEVKMPRDKVVELTRKILEL